MQGNLTTFILSRVSLTSPNRFIQCIFNMWNTNHVPGTGYPAMNYYLPGQRNKKTIRRIYVETNKYQLIKSVINHHSVNSIQLSDKHFLFLEVSRPDLSPGKVKSSAGLRTQLGLQVLSRFSHRKDMILMKSCAPPLIYSTQTPNYVCLYFKKTH